MTAKNQQGLAKKEDLRDLPSTIVSNSQYYLDAQKNHWIIFCATNGINKYNLQTRRYRHTRKHHKLLRKDDLTLLLDATHHELYVIDPTFKMKILNLKSGHWKNEKLHDIQAVFHAFCKRKRPALKVKGYEYWKYTIVYIPHHKIVFFQPSPGPGSKIALCCYDTRTRTLSQITETKYRSVASWVGYGYYDRKEFIRLFYCEAMKKLLFFHEHTLRYLPLDGATLESLGDQQLDAHWIAIGDKKKAHHSLLQSTVVLAVHGFFMVVFQAMGAVARSGNICFYDLKTDKRYKSKLHFDPYYDIAWSQERRCRYDGFVGAEFGMRTIHFMGKSEHFALSVPDIFPEKLRRKYGGIWNTVTNGYLREANDSLDLFMWIPVELLVMVKEFVIVFE